MALQAFMVGDGVVVLGDEYPEVAKNSKLPDRGFKCCKLSHRGGGVMRQKNDSFPRFYPPRTIVIGKSFSTH